MEEVHLGSSIILLLHASKFQHFSSYSHLISLEYEFYFFIELRLIVTVVLCMRLLNRCVILEFENSKHCVFS
jgi:hypothetical protein